MRGAVTASTQEAADAGASLLRAGGNAVDAAVAAGLATCVADPCNTGIAGYGGYMVVHSQGEARAKCVQFPLWAPSGMSPAAFGHAYPEEGPGTSCVPNVVGGLARALRELGRLSWEKASEPAIASAREGVAANANTRRAFEQNRHRAFMAECFEIEEGRGAFTFRQPALQATLERMAAEGPEWFYTGPLGEAACRIWREAGIDVPLADWRGQAEAVEVVEAPCHASGGVRLHGAPLGLSGSACVFAIHAAAARIAARRALTDARGIAELAEAMARIWQYRFAMPGGNDFSGIDLAAWVEDALAYGGARPAAAQAGHTAHVNAVDGEGMLAALTFTHGPAWFGGRWALPGTGVIMNGGMHNFSRPGAVRRGARWFGVSNMSPTIAVQESQRRVALGCPGARRIPANIALALARHLVDARPLQEAVSAGRFHAEEPGRVFVEDGRLAAAAKRELATVFPALEAESRDAYFGPLTAVAVAPGGHIEVAVDDRQSVGFAARA